MALSIFLLSSSAISIAQGRDQGDSHIAINRSIQMLLLTPSGRFRKSISPHAAGLPNVLSIFPNKIHTVHTTLTSWEFLGLYGNGQKTLYGGSEATESSWLWRKAKFGKDIIIGVLDSGVWPESERFSDHGTGPIPERWKGTCETGEQFHSSHCNKKLIGVRFFSRGLHDGPEAYAKANQEVLSPRDVVGHGTHVASTAGGRFVRNTNWFDYTKGTAKGGAPDSCLAIYKICWRNVTASTIRCEDSHILSAFDMGIHHGVDIISASLGDSASLNLRPLERSMPCRKALWWWEMVLVLRGKDCQNGGIILLWVPMLACQVSSQANVYERVFGSQRSPGKDCGMLERADASTYVKFLKLLCVWQRSYSGYTASDNFEKLKTCSFHGTFFIL
ncbi:hypothetical protein SELMODRAFT_417793 [Selaginella moellendorffii]|uniref:Peptidase S8/S53 domain-containing protein n=1 Tax=Selaginella moellendorffii TaxID=88036 RepID=D8S3M7_SELML|nr:hypothetical protein SELMODRAFT_417793 [Selaginella moellendorffii]